MESYRERKRNAQTDEKSRTPTLSSTFTADFCSYADFVMEVKEESGRRITMAVTGSSMQPLLGWGDRVAIRPVPAGRIRSGDVIAFWENGRVVVHRCVGKRKSRDGWQLCEKGDNLAAWRWLPEDQVIGKVERIMKPGRVLNLSNKSWIWLNGALGFFMSILILFAEKTASLDAVDRLRRAVPIFSPSAARVLEAMQALCLLPIRLIATIHIGLNCQRPGAYKVARVKKNTGDVEDVVKGMDVKGEAFSNEERLLVLTARVNPGPAECEEIKELVAGELDWDFLLDHSGRLGVRPLLYRHLSRDVHDRLVPREVKDLLRKDYELQSLRNLRIYGCIRRLLDCLCREGLPVILLKGGLSGKMDLWGHRP